jgi:parallel beta-helix repeat protein
MTLNSLGSNPHIQNSLTRGLDPSTQSQLRFLDNKIASTSDAFIGIGSNSELANAATGGRGTVGDPYILEKMTITTELGYGIFIEHTTSYFMIRNCSIESKIHGIYLDEIADGTAIIKDNFCRKSYHGIRLRRANYAQVINNTCSQNNEVGISTLYSNYILIVNNTCQDASIGISLVASGHATVDNNRFVANVNLGLEISGYKSTVVNNTFIETGVYISDAINNVLTYKVEGNTVNGKALAFLKNLNDIEIANAYGSIGQLILVNCQNVRVINKTITQTTTGITLINCSACEIINSICVQNKRSGIWIVQSSHCRITGSNCSNNWREGIYFSSASFDVLGSSYSSVVNCSCNNNGFAGIGDSGLFTTSLIIANNTCNNNKGGISLQTSNSLVVNNECNNNRGNGITISLLADFVNTVRNNCSNNKHDGIVIEGASNCIIYKNSLKKNGEYGISLRSVETIMHYWIPTGNQILFNKLYIGTNEQNLTSQAYDDGFDNTWLNNYWSNWTSPDSNADGIVDTPYSIDGLADSQDAYPLANQNLSQGHFLTSPTVTYPNGGETLSGIITIECAFSLDSEGHPITYAFYYSVDNGTTWITLETGATNNWCEWDTTTVADGGNYLVKANVSCSEGFRETDTSDGTFIIDNSAPTTTIPSFTIPTSTLPTFTSDTTTTSTSFPSTQATMSSTQPEAPTDYLSFLQILEVGTILFFVLTLVIVFRRQQ